MVKKSFRVSQYSAAMPCSTSTHEQWESYCSKSLDMDDRSWLIFCVMTLISNMLYGRTISMFARPHCHSRLDIHDNRRLDYDA